MKKKFYLIFSLLTLSTAGLRAQSYGTAAGARVGDGFGLTIQQQVGDKATVEFIAESVFKSHDWTYSAIYEQHYNIIPFMKFFNFYMGAGPHLYQPAAGSAIKRGYGVSGIGGVELTLGSFVFSLDYKPLINLSGGNGTFDGQKGFSVRYVIFDRIKAKSGTSIKERLSKMFKW
jgi:hypothetical protein